MSKPPKCWLPNCKLPAEIAQDACWQRAKWQQASRRHANRLRASRRPRPGSETLPRPLWSDGGLVGRACPHHILRPATSLDRQLVTEVLRMCGHNRASEGDSQWCGSNARVPGRPRALLHHRRRVGSARLVTRDIPEEFTVMDTVMESSLWQDVGKILCRENAAVGNDLTRVQDSPGHWNFSWPAVLGVSSAPSPAQPSNQVFLDTSVHLEVTSARSGLPLRFRRGFHEAEEQPIDIERAGLPGKLLCFDHHCCSTHCGQSLRHVPDPSAPVHVTGPDGSAVCGAQREPAVQPNWHSRWIGGRIGANCERSSLGAAAQRLSWNAFTRLFQGRLRCG